MRGRCDYMSILDTLPYESIDLEAKKAAGRDGRGALPKDIWETYSAFANTQGGVILLGVSERKDGSLYATGVQDTQKVTDDFWNTLNNPSKVSVNVLTERDVEVLQEQGRQIIKITVPRAARRLRPVYINGNVLQGSYVRRHTADCRCSETDVRRMLAEQVNDSRDVAIQRGFGLEDIYPDTLRAYRNRLAVVQPDHPYNSDDDETFLRKIGAWRRDRTTGEQGMTLAGLLMFGKGESIAEALPHYLLDYRHLPHERAKTEWLDRLIPDGTWSGNVYDFYRTVIARLTQDVKVPFELVGDVRNDDTPVHKALREALVNTLVHADYSVEKPLLVLKAPDFYGFITPGLMRIPVADAYAGGQSDCRNRTLQTMFSLIHLGEKAGSGIPRIIQNWNSQNYRFPHLWEDAERDATVLWLRAVSLLPPETLTRLEVRFGNVFQELSEYEVLALGVADVEGVVTNQRMQLLVAMHAADITKLLSGLVGKGCLLSSGVGRGTTYCLPGAEAVDLASFRDSEGSFRDKGDSFRDSEGSFRDKEGSFRDKQRDWLEITPEQHAMLLKKAEPVRAKKRAQTEWVTAAIVQLCAEHFLPAQTIAEYLGRSTDDIQRRFVKPMLEQGLLERRFPNVPNHEKQAYRSSSAAVGREALRDE